MPIKAILFDLHGTMAYVKNPFREKEVSEFLYRQGYDVSRQALSAAWAFVAFIDYPKYGYKSQHVFFSRILQRLKVKVDKKTLDELVRLLKQRNAYTLYPDAVEAVIKAKKNGYKTAIVTTIAYFSFKSALKPVQRCFDFIMTGFEARCEKSNPKMYKKTLEILNVEPHEAVMIGDDHEIDIILPKKLGMYAILLNREEKALSSIVADAVAKNLNEALEIVIKKRL